jgi:hypothetical protein
MIWDINAPCAHDGVAELPLIGGRIATKAVADDTVVDVPATGEMPWNVPKPEEFVMELLTIPSIDLIAPDALGVDTDDPAIAGLSPSVPLD